MKIYTTSEIQKELSLSKEQVYVLFKLIYCKTSRPFTIYRITEKQLKAIEKLIKEARKCFPTFPPLKDSYM